MRRSRRSPGTVKPNDLASVLSGRRGDRGRAVSDLEAVTKAIALLDALNGDDPEYAHDAADRILLSLVPAEVREAYQRLVDSLDWWVTA